MNPGKIVDAPRMDENLRYGEQYETRSLETFFSFDEEGGFQEAVELCSGVGQCRKKTRRYDVSLVHGNAR